MPEHIHELAQALDISIPNKLAQAEHPLSFKAAHLFLTLSLQRR